MDLILAMLEDNIKIEEKKWSKFPYNIQKKLEVSQSAKNFALYRYLVDNAIRYPKEWIENKVNVSVIASVAIFNQDVILENIRILSSSILNSNNTIEIIDKNSIIAEVKKTFKRVSPDFPNTESKIELDLPLEWKS